MARVTRLLMPFGVLVISIGLIVLHGLTLGNYGVFADERIVWLLLFAVLSIGFLYALGLPDQRQPGSAGPTAVAAEGLAILCVSLLQLAVGEPLLPRFVLLGAFMIIPVYVAVLVAIAGTRSFGDRVILLVKEADESTVRSDVAGAILAPAIVVGSLAPEEVADRPEMMRELILTTRADMIVISRAALEIVPVVDAASALHEGGLRVRSLQEFYRWWVGKLPVGELARSSLMFDVREIHRPRYARTSRIVDLLVALPGLFVLVFVTPVIALLNLVGNRGPLFFRQERVGRGGRLFNILKFRSMFPSEESSVWTSQGDARITPFGKVLRNSHVDELPQVLNILRGDLSVVGPRPEQPEVVQELIGSVPYYGFRHSVKPGLTGWAQVNFGYGSNETDAIEKLQYDFWYLQEQSIWLDLRIILRTVRQVFGLKGR